MSVEQFIKQIAAGQTSDATETLTNVLSNLAFEALDNKKQEVAHNIFNSPVVEEETLSEASLTAGKRLVHKVGEGIHTAKVYHDKDYNEYQAHFYKNGKHMGEGPVSYHDDKEDAINSANAGLEHMNSKN